MSAPKEGRATEEDKRKGGLAFKISTDAALSSAQKENSGYRLSF